MPNHYIQHANARQLAFSWYLGAPPSADDARNHFASKAISDPAHRALYAEALDIFLATCWKVSPPSQEQIRDKHV